jgi:hypothetical protein
MKLLRIIPLALTILSTAWAGDAVLESVKAETKVQETTIALSDSTKTSIYRHIKGNILGGRTFDTLEPIYWGTPVLKENGTQQVYFRFRMKNRLGAMHTYKMVFFVRSDASVKMEMANLRNTPVHDRPGQISSANAIYWGQVLENTEADK